MSISNYSELLVAVRDYTENPDLLDTQIQRFIKMTEVRMLKKPCGLKVAWMASATEYTLLEDASSFALAANVQDVQRISIVIDGSESAINETPAAMLLKPQDAGRPTAYAVYGHAVNFDKVADQDYTFRVLCAAGPTDLTSAAPTNFVITNYPDIYLYGCLWQYHLFSGEEGVSAHYYNLFEESIAGANAERERKIRTVPAVRGRRFSRA